MCYRTRPIKKFVPVNEQAFKSMSNKQKLIETCKRCGLLYKQHAVEPEKATLVRACDDNA